MKQKIFVLVIAFFGFYQTIIAQNELVIEITTDNNAEETHWVLYDLSNTVIQESQPFSDLTTYRDTIQLESSKCYYWTLYDTYGDGMMGGFTPGSYRVFFDGVLLVENSNPNYTDSINIFNIGASCSSNESRLMEVSMNSHISKEPTQIGATIFNMGEAIITSVEVYYEVNDIKSASVVINGLNIAVGEIETIWYPTAYDFNTAGDFRIVFGVEKINGTADSYEGDNMVSKEITVVDGIVRKNMIEMMTSSSDYCPYCYDANQNVDTTLLRYPGTYSMAKYFPKWWGDSKYIPNNDERASLYSDWMSEGSLFINGNPIYYIAFPTLYIDSIGMVSDVKISMSGYLEGDSIYATVAVLPMKNIDDAVYLRGMAVQLMCHDNQLRGGEFLHPTYGYLPNPEGVLIPNLVKGEELVFSFTGSILDYPLEEGSLTDMLLNFYVQKKKNRQILQSESIHLTYKKVEPIISYNIVNEAINVDTSSLKIIIQANRALYTSEGTDIGDIKNHLIMKVGALNGVTFPFNAQYDQFTNQITITPKYEWYTETTYFLIVKNLATIDNIAIPNDTLKFTTNSYVGVAESHESAIQVFPNPALNSVSITGDKGVMMEILSIDGQLLETIRNENGTVVHDISAYKSGLYFIRTESKDGKQIVKFIKL